MSTQDHPRRTRRTRAQLEQDIHQAVGSALLERGYKNVTFEDVAQRAHVSKPVLYRRFSDRPTMVLTMLKRMLTERLASNDTSTPRSETLRDDLVTWLTHAHSRAVSIGRDTYRGLIGEAPPEALSAIAGVSDTASTELRTRVIDPAVDRGELGTAPIPDIVLLAPLHLLRDAVVFDEPVPEIGHFVDTVALPMYRTASGR